LQVHVFNSHILPLDPVDLRCNPIVGVKDLHEINFDRGDQSIAKQ